MSEIQESTISTSESSDEALIEKKAAKTTWRVVVSLEPVTSPILTWRGEFQCGSMSTAAARGIRAARKANPGRKAKSLSLVVEKA
jgi:hypothetical protein